MATITAAKYPTVMPWTTRVLWEALTEANSDGSGVEFSDYADRSVQVIGTFGGATIALQGSNDGGTTWAALSDPQGNALSFTSAGIEQVGTISQMIRPIVTGGASVDVDVWLFARANKR